MPVLYSSMSAMALINRILVTITNPGPRQYNSLAVSALVAFLSEFIADELSQGTG